MNGARALLETLVAHEVDTCFMNPGTSEMHFVAALDDVTAMRSVLCLFEGVATGAADGFARLAGRPAAVLLHLGPGLGNGLANLHNARRAHSPLVAVVGDHATTHWKYDAQLQSDIETVARNVSTFVHTSLSTESLSSDAAAAVAAAVGAPGSVATLILPADVSWSEGASPVVGARAVPVARPVDTTELDGAAAALRGSGPCAVLVGGRACTGTALERAAAIATATGAKLLAETFPARLERGAGRPPVERLGYLAEFTAMQLDGIAHLVLVDAASPVSFFAYPGKPSDLVPEGCQVHTVAGPGDDVDGALEALAYLVGATPDQTPRQQAGPSGMPRGTLDAAAVAAVIGQLLPEGAIVSDEGNTSGLFVSGATAGSPPHDWLCLAGGAIGQGLPVALGAAIACPDRRVVALEADGSSLYTPQAWWSMARAGCDVTTVLLNNGSYAILNLELDRVGAERPGPRAKDMLDLGRPDIDFVSLARGLGVPAERATTADELAAALSRSFATPGPSVVEVPVPSIL
ncbi:MAG: acetolactate synthase large subunit [Actinomycetota bacterium]|nr:acetolactate synthase large subunit [Actinomycetota bacterium]